MSGNVYEFVQDWHHDNYSGAPSDGSAWITGSSQEYRVLRGGSWYDSLQDSRAAYRDGYNPALRGNSTDDYQGYNHGFRLAKTP